MKLNYVLIVLSLYSILGFSNSIDKSSSFSQNNEKTKIITLFWDASYSLNNKNLNKELEFIDAYFKYIKDAELTLVVYSNIIINSKHFIIENGNVESLKTELRNIDYDGYGTLPETKNYSVTDTYLYFTNGVSFDKNISLKFTSPVLVVNSSENANTARLHNLAYNTFGYFIDLNVNSVDKCIKDIKSGKLLRTELNEQLEPLNNNLLITGTVRDEKTVLVDVNIRKLNSLIGTTTNKMGEYSIKAQSGDVLSFKYIGKQVVNVKIGKHNIINVLLPIKTESLKEVIIEADKTETEEIEYVTTGYGEQNRKALGYSVQSIDEDDINTTAPTLGQTISGKFTGVRMEQNQNLGSLIIRESRTISDGSNPDMFSPYPLFILNGVPLRRSTNRRIENLDFIDPSSVTDITILKGLSATNRYGSEGANGVVLITTKSAKTPSENKLNSNRRYKPPSLEKFKGSLTISDIEHNITYGKLIFDDHNKPNYNMYLEYRDRYLNNSDYFFDASKSFFNEGDFIISDRILSNIQELFSKNTSVLRTLAFTYQVRENYDAVLKIYQQILELSPRQVQSYIDVAVALGQAGKHNEAIKMFTQILDGTINKDLDFNSIHKNTFIEFKRLLKNRDQSWDTSEISEDYFTSLYFPKRIELKWNSYDTRFRINIIKPNKDLLYLGHTDKNNKLEIKEEFVHGITSKQNNFLKAEKGTWYINIQDIPKEKIAGSQYLLVILYSNYGSINEKKITKLLKLDPSFNGKTFAEITVK